MMVESPFAHRPLPGLVGEALFRGAALALLWWLLVHGEGGSWTIGLPVVIAATALSIALAPQAVPGARLRRMPGFVVYFMRESFIGGVDVVYRALHPGMPLNPDFVTVPVADLGPFQRLLFAVLVSLMPGTLSARLHEDALLVHVLDREQPVAQSLARLRGRLAQLFSDDRNPPGDRP